MKAAYRLPEEEGTQRLKEQADWLEQQYSSEAATLREGLKETFAFNRLGLPLAHRQCLATTNLAGSSNAGMRSRTKRVTHWQDGRMILRWAASTLVFGLLGSGCLREAPGLGDCCLTPSPRNRRKITYSCDA